MAENSKIQWLNSTNQDGSITHGHTASPWYGCSHVHAGCDNCYAELMAKRNPGTLGIWGDEGTRVKSKSFIANLHKWNKAAESAGVVQSVFPSICDPFEDRPELEPWRKEMFDAIDACQSLQFLLLTKRPQNVRRMWPSADIFEGYAGDDKPAYWPNIWLLTSISDQPTADAMIPELLKCRDLVPMLGVSAEPLLGPVDFASIQTDLQWPRKAEKSKLNALRGYTYSKRQKFVLNGITEEKGETNFVDVCNAGALNWVIVGSESGHNRRPMQTEWAESIVGQCKAAGVACFVKQLSVDGKVTGDMAAFPASLQVRQFPQAVTA